MSLVGAVKEINELDIVVSLPNQLTGFVSITEISDLITQKVSLVAKAEDDDDEELPDLNDYFSIGMPVVVCITRLEDANQKDQSKRRIELSMRPEIINACLSAQDVTKGMSICANVKSEEDHGYVLSLGIKGLSGFMVKDSSKVLKLGSWVFINVVECNEAMNVVKCEFPKDFKKCLISNSHSMEIESFKAGMAVNATVKSVTDYGLVMSFMGYFMGTVDFLHLNNLDLDSVEVGKKFPARIIYTDLDKKKFGLSLNPFMVSWSESSLLSVSNLEVGLIVDRAKVKSIEKHGLLLELPGLGKGFVHVSNLSDSKVEKVDKNFKVGSTHRARIISLDYLDDLILVTFQSSVIEQPIMTYDDIKVGSIVKVFNHIYKLKGKSY
jgi:rRNA biogenesis protein RRP5